MAAYDLIRRGLFRLDPESAHGVAMRAGKLAQATVPGVLAARYRHRSERVAQELWDLSFDSPVGLAAGFDKNAELLRFWRALGFGFAEVGSVSARPSGGNDRPRAFRLPADAALINRMGLNNDGARVIAERLARAPVPGDFPIGVNLAKTHDPTIVGDAAIDDFCDSFAALAPHADYVALNVSCPNTREGKTFEEPEAFEQLLAAVARRRQDLGHRVPVLVKLGPPPPSPQPIPSTVMRLVDIALERGIDGFIACNTASDRLGLSTPGPTLESIGRGGLSGAPLARRSTRLIRHLYRRLQGEVPIIGVGGVSSVESAIEKITAGASLVELYTGMVYEGPGLASRLARGIDRWLHEQGYAHISDAVGVRCDE